MHRAIDPTNPPTRAAYRQPIIRAMHAISCTPYKCTFSCSIIQQFKKRWFVFLYQIEIDQKPNFIHLNITRQQLPQLQRCTTESSDRLKFYWSVNLTPFQHQTTDSINPVDIGLPGVRFLTGPSGFKTQSLVSGVCCFTNRVVNIVCSYYLVHLAFSFAGRITISNSSRCYISYRCTVYICF